MRRCTRVAVSLSIACLALVVVGWSCPPVGAQDSAVVEKAGALISDNQDTIALIMHPTATLKSIEQTDCSSTRDGGCKLTYRMNFKCALGIKFHVIMSYYFDEDGDFEFCTVDRTTGGLKPFVASNLALGVIKSRLKKTSEVQSNKQLLKQLERANSKDLLEMYLKYRG